MKMAASSVELMTAPAVDFTSGEFCSGLYDDHTRCSTKVHVFFEANPQEVCGLGDTYDDVDLLVTPTQWYKSFRPCWTWGEDGSGMPTRVFSQPSSTLFVMIVAVICFVVSRQLHKTWRHREDGIFHLSRLLWAFSMGAWGVGTFFAGLSYEALEWHLKCTGYGSVYCLAYSWMEIVYIVFQTGACCSILIAVAFSSQVRRR